MSHLDDERLFELGLAGTQPTAAESAHLEQCETCAARLAEEQGLTAKLDGLSFPEVPAGFSAAATQRFARARDVRRARRIGAALVAAMVLGHFVALPLLMAALQGLGTFVKEAALLLADVATWIDATVTLFLSAPTMSLLSLAALAAVLLFWTGILARLGRQSAVEISGAVGS